MSCNRTACLHMHHTKNGDVMDPLRIFFHICGHNLPFSAKQTLFVFEMIKLDKQFQPNVHSYLSGN